MKCEVDWEDTPYPKIRRSSRPQAVTFAAARQEIVEHFLEEIRHARVMITQARAMRTADALEEVPAPNWD